MRFKFLIAATLGCLSYFSTDYKTGFAISSAKGFVLLYSETFKFFTTLEKNEFSSSVTFLSWVKILSFFTNVIFSFDLSLLERREITDFQNFLLSATSFSFQFALYCFLVFLKRLKIQKLRCLIKLILLTSDLLFRNRFRK